MKIKELIAKLQEFDGELEVITMAYDGHKERRSLVIDAEIFIQENVELWSYDSLTGDRACLEKALVIGYNP